MNGILKLNNVMTDELCKNLIQYHTNNKESCKRYTHDTPYNNVDCLELRLIEGSALDNLVYDCVVTVIEKYISVYPKFTCSGDVGYQLREITGQTKEHIDNVLDRDGRLRNISIIFGLNSDYENGEFHFPFQKYTTTVKRGQAIVFPVYFMYPHSVDAPIGSRYTINTWLLDGFQKSPFIPPGTHDD